MSYLLGIDLGTSATKTVLFDIEGNVIKTCSIQYPMFQPQNGYAEQDPNDWLNATLNGIKTVIDSSKVNARDIKGVGISGQMHGLVMLDKNGEVLRNSIIWCDQRTGKECAEITEKVGKKRLIEITANPALTGFTASKILWVRNNEPEIYEKTAYILLPKDFIRFKLTGEFATEVSDASGMQLLDIKNRCWSNEVLEKLNIDKSLLGRVYESPEITGEITSEVEKLTGLKKGTIVVGGAGDNAAAAVGTGVVKDSKAFTTIGTSGVVFAHCSEMVLDLEGRVHTFCSAVPNEWHVMGVTQAAGLSLKWFRDNFCNSEIELSNSLGIDPYEIMTKEAKTVPIGANNLIYLPYLMGERTPHLDENCRGAFIGLSAIHTKKDMIRAVLEGVSYSLKDCQGIINKLNINVSDMMVCGGGANSTLWGQMLADLYNCPVKTTVSKEGPALGVAILAGVGSGVYNSVEEGCENLIKTNRKKEPIPENTKKYMEVYKIYKSIYPKLKDIFCDLHSI